MHNAHIERILSILALLKPDAYLYVDLQEDPEDDLPGIGRAVSDGLVRQLHIDNSDELGFGFQLTEAGWQTRR